MTFDIAPTVKKPRSATRYPACRALTDGESSDGVSGVAEIVGGRCSTGGSDASRLRDGPRPPDAVASASALCDVEVPDLAVETMGLDERRKVPLLGPAVGVECPSDEGRCSRRLTTKPARSQSRCESDRAGGGRD
jgi:hypothetical protein